MLDHIGIRVADYERSTKFYAAALAPLGYALFMEGASGAGFRKGYIPQWHLVKARHPRAGGGPCLDCREKMDSRLRGNDGNGGVSS
jgi:catechol 2,3-dioxygenase-like lactoylglutathione lyase family enzyme